MPNSYTSNFTKQESKHKTRENHSKPWQKRQHYLRNCLVSKGTNMSSRSLLLCIRDHSSGAQVLP